MAKKRSIGVNKASKHRKKRGGYRQRAYISEELGKERERRDADISLAVQFCNSIENSVLPDDAVCVAASLGQGFTYNLLTLGVRDLRKLAGALRRVLGRL